MADPVVKEKAEEMFVVNGFSMDTITQILDGEVSRKTLYNWRNEKDENGLTWEDKRRARAKRTTDIREELEEGLKEAMMEWRISKDPKLLFGIGKITEALKRLSTFDLPGEKVEKNKEKKKGLTPERIKEIEKEFGLV